MSVDAWLHGEAAAGHDEAVVGEFAAVKVDAAAMNLGVDAVAGAVLDVATISGFLDDGPNLQV